MVRGYNAQEADRYFCEPKEELSEDELQKQVDYLEDKANWDYDALSGN